MTGILTKAVLVAGIVSITACSSLSPIEERKTFAQPDWYKNCAQAGTEGWFWWEKEFAYACGAGESAYLQAAEEQMYAVAMNNFAKRINGKVNSETEIAIINDKKTTKTLISYKVADTAIRKHLQRDMGQFTMSGKHYTFVRLKIQKSDFDQLIAEAKGN